MMDVIEKKNVFLSLLAISQEFERRYQGHFEGWMCFLEILKVNKIDSTWNRFHETLRE